MEILAGGLVAVAFFALGVVFHKYAISEVENLKRHISEEIGGLRAKVGTLADQVSKKL
jgi:hypothetical protein